MAATGTRIRQHTNRLFFSRRDEVFGDTPADLTEIDLLTYLNSPPTVTRGADRRARTGVAGVEFPTQVDDYKVGVSLSMDAPLGINMASVVVPFAYGDVTVAAGPPATYTCRVQATNALPVTHMILEGTSTRGRDGSDVLYKDLACNSFTISGSGNADGVVNITSEWMGSGQFSEDQTYDADSPTLIRDGLCRMGNVFFSLGPDSAEVTRTAQLADFTYTFANNMIDNYFPGGDKYGTNSLAGNERVHTFEFSLYEDGTDDILDYFTPEGGTLLAATLKMTQDDNSQNYIELKIPQLKIVAVEQTNVNDHNCYRVRTQILFDEDGTGYDATDLSGAYIVISKTASAFATAPLTNFS